MNKVYYQTIIKPFQLNFCCFVANYKINIVIKNLFLQREVRPPLEGSQGKGGIHLVLPLSQGPGHVSSVTNNQRLIYNYRQNTRCRLFVHNNPEAEVQRNHAHARQRESICVTHLDFCLALKEIVNEKPLNHQMMQITKEI